MSERVGRTRLGFSTGRSSNARLQRQRGSVWPCSGQSINQSNNPRPPHLISALTRGEAQHTHPTQFQSSPDHLGRGRAKKGSSNTGEHSSDPPPSARRPLHTLSPVRFASSRLPRVCSPTALGRLGHTSGAPRKKGLMMRRGWRGTITGGRVRAVPSRAGGRGC